MGKHTGEPAPVDRGALRQRFLRLAAGMTVTIVAWGYLVWAAIDFGGQARNGESLAWVFLVMATLGATACLFMCLILGGKLMAILRGDVAPDRPSTPPGGRRAKR
ncbi:hypothetical protein [Marmoricola sp. RAF53]|uniref:hypothetical protein n=1 Tax=Marmoricola sp. RAF53 TaxID=3233059 RepID=UPI003F9CD073